MQIALAVLYYVQLLLRIQIPPRIIFYKLPTSEYPVAQLKQMRALLDDVNPYVAQFAGI